MDDRRTSKHDFYDPDDRALRRQIADGIERDRKQRAIKWGLARRKGLAKRKATPAKKKAGPAPQQTPVAQATFVPQHPSCVAAYLRYCEMKPLLRPRSKA
jgi:cytochrome c-type biogenesis protein CcmH/NrfG